MNLTIDTQAIWSFITTEGTHFGLRVLGALAAWVVGRWMIRWLTKLIGLAITRSSHIDRTLSHYLTAITSVLLNIVLVLSILEIFGFHTTSLAALLAGAGLAIGTAWGGLLTHFAAGVFIQVLRPYKLGDLVTISGVTGRVKELGLFGTTLVTSDKIVTIVGNNKVFSDVIQNHSALPVRRVDTTIKLAHSVDIHEAIARIKAVLATLPNVLAEPPPEVEVLSLTPEGPLLAVRPYTQTENYWQVYHDTHKAVITAFAKAGYPQPESAKTNAQIEAR